MAVWTVHTRKGKTLPTVKTLYKEARAAYARVRDGEAAKWELAELMDELYSRGQVQDAIAREIGCSVMTVSNYLAVMRSAPEGTLQSPVENRPPFGEVMHQVRPWTDAARVRRGRLVPKEPAAKAKFVADLLKDKDIADSPAVRKVEERHTERRIRQEMSEFRKDHGISARTEPVREEVRRQSVTQNQQFWLQTIATMQTATRAVLEAVGELERTGMPRVVSGDMIREARTLAGAAGRLEERAQAAALGNAGMP